MTHRKEVFQKALSKMGDEFTSNAFCEKVRSFGVKANDASDFLRMHCEQGSSRRMWRKIRGNGDALPLFQVQHSTPKAADSTVSLVFSFMEVCKKHGVFSSPQFFEDMKTVFSR